MPLLLAVNVARNIAFKKAIFWRVALNRAIDPVSAFRRMRLFAIGVALLHHAAIWTRRHVTRVVTLPAVASVRRDVLATRSGTMG